jgi:hypothetical protein
MVKTNPLGFRVEPELKAALERAAADDGRSVSGMAERILREWLIANSYLSKPKPNPRARRERK